MFNYIINRIMKNPLWQAWFVIIMILIINIFIFLTLNANSSLIERMQIWIFSATGLFFYVVISVVIGIATKDFGKYYVYSLLGYGMVFFLSIFLATYTSGLSIDEAMSMRWIYTLFSIGYIILLTILGLMRKVISFAQRA